jgi:hypothetical protein
METSGLLVEVGCTLYCHLSLFVISSSSVISVCAGDYGVRQFNQFYWLFLHGVPAHFVFFFLLVTFSRFDLTIMLIGYASTSCYCSGISYPGSYPKLEPSP